MSRTIRQLLEERSGPLTHFTRKENFKSIVTHGLRPSDPWESFGKLVQTTDTSRNFICLSPSPSRTPVQLRGDGEFFYVACDVSSLTDSFVPDSSFGDLLSLMEGIRQRNPDACESEVVVMAAIELGSIAYSDSIPAELLRVRCKECDALDPTGWPLLKETPIEVVHFDKAGIGDDEPDWG